jgi:hypothetical protein
MFAALANDRTAYYENQLPNLLLSPDPPTNINSASQYQNTVSTYNPYSKQSEANDPNWASYVRGLDIDQATKDAAAVCRSAKSPEELAGTVDYYAKVRCGWVYKKGPTGSPNPEVSQGVLGTIDGPLPFLDYDKGGQWFWDLTDAQKRIDKARCECLTNCRDVGGADFYGKCGFCKSQGRAVPVRSDGSLKYPQDSVLSCSPSELVREAGSCPPPPAPGSPAALAAAQDVCAMDANGQVSRNCLLNRLMSAGCSDKGSLSVALQTGATPDNYSKGLEAAPAFQKYQLFATTPLNTDILRQGKGSAQLALAEFQRLSQDAKTKDETTAIGASARDLCSKQGFFEKYDFCTELSDSTRSPFALECLQKEFRRQGGQPAGTLYPVDTTQGNPLQAELNAINEDMKYLTGLGLNPSSGNETFNNRYARQKELNEQLNAGNTFNYWNVTYNTWGEVRSAIGQLVLRTKSTDKTVQAVALKQLLGISREKDALNQIDPQNGFEIFFFPYPGYGNDDKLTFLGRRVLNSEDFPQNPNWTTGNKFNTGFKQMHFAIVTNLRPNQAENNVAFQVTTSDGTALAVNADIDPIRTNVTEPNYFSRFFNQASTQYANVCTQLATNGPNYVTIRYYDGGGSASFNLQFRNCSSGEVKTIPSYMFSLTQEPAAPLASFEVINRDNSIFFEELRLGRGLFKGTTGGNGRVGIAENTTIAGNLIPYRISGGASWQVKTRIAYQSLRTISFIWQKDGSSTTNSTIFYWLGAGNGLKVGITGSQLTAIWKMGDATIQGSAAAPLTGNGPYYTRITFEATDTLLPSKIRIATIPVSVNDTTQLERDANQTILTPSNGILFDRYIRDNNMAGFMGFGAAPGETTQSNPVGLLIGFLHLFDYVLDGMKSQLDIAGQWKRKFIY